MKLTLKLNNIKASSILNNSLITAFVNKICSYLTTKIIGHLYNIN